MKKMIIALSLVMSLLMGSQVMARGPRNGGNGMGTGWRMSTLNLTQEQNTKLVKLRQNLLKETTETRSKLASMRVKFQSFFVQQGVGEEELKKMYSGILSLQEKLQKKRFDFRLAMRKLLTPTQLSMLSQGRGFMGGHGMGRGFRKGRGRHHVFGRGIASAF